MIPGQTGEGAAAIPCSRMSNPTFYDFYYHGGNLGAYRFNHEQIQGYFYYNQEEQHNFCPGMGPFSSGRGYATQLTVHLNDGVSGLVFDWENGYSAGCGFLSSNERTIDIPSGSWI